MYWVEAPAKAKLAKAPRILLTASPSIVPNSDHFLRWSLFLELHLPVKATALRDFEKEYE